ncbi:MAG: hypothetical protein LBK53_04170 [Heliobacteriaceae bacterium]|jgi:hypothetical protein|nr:hypothetical protein [Heliobacteriaceae bacterium]
MPNNHINPYYEVPMQAQIAGAPVMQGDIPVNPEAVKQSVGDSYVGERAKSVTENPLPQALLTLPIWLGLGKGMDWFAEKCRGPYNTTVEYKIGNFGDNLTKTIKNSPFGGFAQSMVNGTRKFGSWINRNIVEHVAVLRAFRDTPSKPTNKMVQGQANGMRGFLLFDYPHVAENFVKPLNYAQDLDCYGADKQFIDKIKAKMKGKPAAEKAKILRSAEFELVSKTKDPALIAKFEDLSTEAQLKVLQNRKARAFGFKNHKHMTELIKDIQSNPEEIIKACRKAEKNMYSKILVNDNNVVVNWVRKLFGKPPIVSESGNFYNQVKGYMLGRKVYASEFTNKLIGSSPNLNPHTTKLGSWLPKISNQLLEGATNGVTGGKLARLMQAVFLAEVVLKTAKAEKGDKGRTFAERFIELVGFFITMPIAIQLMHRVGGMQYAGMSKQAVENYRAALKTFNEKALNAGFASKNAYKAEKKALTAMKKANIKNPITGLLKWGAGVLTGGLETLGSYRTKAFNPKAGAGAKIGDFLRHPGHYMKNGGGSVLRFAAALFMLMPMLNKIGVKASHAIFGRPKHSTLDKEEDKPKEPETNQPPDAQTVQTPPAQPTQPPTPQPQAPNYVKPEIYPSRTNLINKIKHPELFANSAADSTADSKKKYQEPVRTYIPSPAAAQLQGENYDVLNEAMKRSEAAEKMALEALAMKV